MADISKFGGAKHSQFGDAQHCAQCEAMLADALDGTLSAADQAAFDVHLAGCPSCAGMMADARRGAEWMETLRSPRPEPSAALLERILAQTSGKAAEGAGADGRSIVLGGNDYIRDYNTTLLGRPVNQDQLMPAQAAYAAGRVLPFKTRFVAGLRSIGDTMLQPRLAMTAAMAFFSIALTLNLTGIRITSLRASDFTPSSILRNCYETKARVARYSDNLRVVYELESRVRDLQHSDNDPLPAQTPQNNPSQDPNGHKQQPSEQNHKPAHPGPGSSRRETPTGNLHFVDSPHASEYHPAPATEALVRIAPSVFIKQEGGLV